MVTDFLLQGYFRLFVNYTEVQSLKGSNSQYILTFAAAMIPGFMSQQ